jgi:hypothetical protein
MPDPSPYKSSGVNAGIRRSLQAAAAPVGVVSTLQTGYPPGSRHGYEKPRAIRFMIVNTSAWWGGHQVLIAQTGRELWGGIDLVPE